MKKNKKMVTGLVIGMILAGSSVAFSQAGSEKDPLVTLSFLNKKVEEVYSYIDSKLSTGPSATVDNAFKVVEIEAGQMIVGGSGSEIILRAGDATAIGSNLGGLTDVTAGLDIDTDSRIKKNHLLLVPRDDGRGIYAKTKVYAMVRGSYRVE